MRFEIVRLEELVTFKNLKPVPPVIVVSAPMPLISKGLPTSLDAVAVKLAVISIVLHAGLPNSVINWASLAAVQVEVAYALPSLGLPR